MFHFIHGYVPGEPYWDGLIKKGFIDDTSGVKLVQHAPTKPSSCFNEAAAIGTPLFEIIREANRPFYLDRLQGGSYYYAYPFELSLIEQYEELLGERFLGFQLHEWASNFKQDWQRIEEVMPDENWDADALKKHFLNQFPYPYVFLESQSIEEFAAMKKQRPKSGEEMLVLLRKLFLQRKRKVKGHLLPADSYYIASKLELEAGASHLLPEVGSQIPFTRIQIALVRGCCRSKGVFWGTYYEPWGGNPFSTCLYKTDDKNEWDINTSGQDFPYTSNGFNGGSSRSLQRRILFYSYLSGARYISEEWGICNTFYDWKDFEISPYGRVKKDFLDFVRQHPDIGKPFTPFALVLPKELEVFDLDWIRGNPDHYLSFPASPAIQKKIKAIAEICHLIYGSGNSAFGNEAHAMTNSSFGDLFDFVYEDDENLFSRYSYVIDLTGEADFSAKHSADAIRILSVEDSTRLAVSLTELSKKLLPFQIKAENVHWLVNRCSDGWIIAFFNNDGILQTGEYGEQRFSEADVPVVLSLPGNSNPELIYGEMNPQRNGNLLSFTVPAGQLGIFRIR